MPISGLILTLDDAVDTEQLVRDLRLFEGTLEVGEMQGNQLPAVLETATAEESQAVHDQLLSVPGVASVDVVFVSTE